MKVKTITQSALPTVHKSHSIANKKSLRANILVMDLVGE